MMKRGGFSFRRIACLLLSLVTVLSLLCVCPMTVTVTAGAEEAENPFVSDGVAVKKLTIAGNDLKEYVIIHNDESTFTDCAEHLARYLLSSTGIDVPLKLDTDTPEGAKEIRVGYTNRDTGAVEAARKGLGDDGYLILSDGDALFISGLTARGTCNGVYSFLEDYVGVRFFTRTLRPAKAADLVEVPGDLNVTYVPPFSYRRDNWQDTLDNWVCANKLNGNTGTMIGGGVGNVDYSNGFGSMNFYSFTSTIGVWTETKGGTNKQPCLSDETNYQNALKNVRDALIHNPGATVVSVTPYDSEVSVGGCHCDACRAVNDPEGSEMASLLLFCNRLADDLAEEYPDVRIETIAYHYTAKPPKTIRPSDRVIVQYAPIQACYAHPLGTCDSDKYKSAESYQYLTEWAEICAPGNLWIWDYNADFGYVLAPFNNYDVLYENVHTYAALGVGGVFMECVGNTEIGQFTEMNHYLLGRLLWNPNMTKEEYYRDMDEFLQAYYGAGWKYIRTYIDRLTERQAGGHYGIWDTAADVWRLSGDKADDAFMDELRALWDNALAAAAGNEEQYANVEKSSIHFRYAYMIQQTQSRASLGDLNTLRSLMTKYWVTSLGAHSVHAPAQIWASLPMGDSSMLEERKGSPDAYYVMDAQALAADASFINDCEMTEMSENGLSWMHMEGKRDPYMNYPSGTVCLNQGARFVVLIYRSDKEQTGRMYSRLETVLDKLVTEQQDFTLENTNGEFRCVLIEFTEDQARAANDYRFDPVDGLRIRNVALDVARVAFFFNEEAARAYIAAFEAGEEETQPDTEPETQPGTEPVTEAPGTEGEDTTEAVVTTEAPGIDTSDESETAAASVGCGSTLVCPALLLLTAAALTVCVRRKDGTA